MKKLNISLFLFLGCSICAHSELIHLDLNDIVQHQNVAQVVNELVYPDREGLGTELDLVEEKSKVYFDRIYFRFDPSNKRLNASDFWFKSGVDQLDRTGFSGQDVLTQGLPAKMDGGVSFSYSNGKYRIELDKDLWYGVTGMGNRHPKLDPVVNDWAIAIRVEDDGDGVVSDGDRIRIVHVVYATENDSVFGHSAEELSNNRVVVPEPVFLR